MENKTENRGGKRIGSGKPKLTYDIARLSFTVPKDIENELKIEIKNIIKNKTKIFLNDKKEATL